MTGGGWAEGARAAAVAAAPEARVGQPSGTRVSHAAAVRPSAQPHPPYPSPASLGLLTDAVGPRDDDDICHVEEEAVLDDAGQARDGSRRGTRVLQIGVGWEGWLEGVGGAGGRSRAVLTPARSEARLLTRNRPF